MQKVLHHCVGLFAFFILKKQEYHPKKNYISHSNLRLSKTLKIQNTTLLSLKFNAFSP